VCECLANLCPVMEARGLWVDSTLISRRVVISLSWYPGYQRKRGERLPVMIADYCPFCGKDYEENKH
jgi:hypothetical protein